ncbi:MAG: hypothetical protein CVT84_12915 [Alphaproteobacteria bacterium HGW-Alphaproteobacteria-6]|nr:MAG: hypothetical protein CVT84_12915 [Alphaproteobacteria bacterium HGW-Alphaproteobacteria-6]
MTRIALHRPVAALSRFWRDEAGTTLVELAMVIPLFLLLFFALIDFGRMGAEYVMADKAMQRAARIAVTRPPACPGTLPPSNDRGTSPTAPKFGTSCSAAANVCAVPVAMTCTAVAGNPSGNPTVDEIWAAISPLLPVNSTEANLSFRYDPHDPNDPNAPQLGFLGGPYVPIVTVELVSLQFTFVTPLSGLAALASPGGSGFTAGPRLTFPAMSTSLPAEDLADGDPNTN